MNELVGAGIALVTPFKDDLSVDYSALDNIVNFNIENGIDYLVISGTTGESVTITSQEKKEIINAIKKTNNGRLPLVVGIGGNNTAEVIEEIKTTDFSGITAILSVTPYYNKPSQEGLYQHYKAIANAIEIPVMLYNVPGRTAVDLEAATAIRLYDDVENIYAIKEATGSLERATALLSKRKDFRVISGDDAIDFAMMANGGSGIISVTANILPNLKSKLVHSAQEGDLETAKRINNELYNLNKALFVEANPVPIKAVMYLAGLIDTLEYRLPLTPPSTETMQLLEKTLEQYEVIK